MCLAEHCLPHITVEHVMLDVQEWEIDKLVAYVRNPRKNDAVVDQMVAAIKEFGFRIPVVAKSDGTVVDGHLRLKAAKVLGLKTIPVALADELTDTQIKAFRLLANQSANWAEWDNDLLKLEIADLHLADFDLELLGFGDDLTDLLDPDLLDPEDKNPDDVPDIPDEAHSELGDVWVLGPHRLMCGSSTTSDDWMTLMDGEKADIQLCDPPYNVNYESDLAGKIENDNMGDGDFRQFLLDFYSCSYLNMKPGAPMYVSHSDSEGINFRSAFIEAGFKLSGCLTWRKDQFVLGRLDYQPISEPILYGWKTGAAHRWYGGRKNITVQDVGEYPPFEKMPDGRYAIRSDDKVIYIDGSTVVEEAETSMIFCPKPKRSPLHPTMKPVALWERLLRNSARRGDIVIDGFGGSGTTLMAAERMGMSSRLMELDPRFVDVICARYYKYTGRAPVHALTGATFPKKIVDDLTASWEEVKDV